MIAPDPKPYKAKGAAAPNNKKKSSGGSTGGFDLSAILKMAGRPSAPVDTAALLRQASQAAKADVAANIASYHAEQNRLLQQAQERARLVNQVAAAAAGYTQGIGDQTAQSYQDAANQSASYAQGFTGQLRDTAAAEAAKVQAGMQAVGQPGQPDTAQAPALANALYGLGGVFPANTFQQTGQAFAAAQREIPAAFRGYGQQQAIGILGAGQDAAGQYTPQIIAEQNKLPSLTNTYASQLTKMAMDQAKLDQQNRLFPITVAGKLANIDMGYKRLGIENNKLTLAQKKALADQTYRDTMTKYKYDALNAINEYRQGNLDLAGLRAKIAEYNSQIAAQNAITSATNAATTRDNSRGWWVDKSGIPHPVKGYKLVPDKVSGGVRAVKLGSGSAGRSPATVARYRAKLPDLTAEAFFGKNPKPVTDKFGRQTIPGMKFDPQTKQWQVTDDALFTASGGVYAKDWFEAIQDIQLQTGGLLPLPTIKKALSRYYKPGQHGRPGGSKTAISDFGSAAGNVLQGLGISLGAPYQVASG